MIGRRRQAPSYLGYQLAETPPPESAPLDLSTPIMQIAGLSRSMAVQLFKLKSHDLRDKQLGIIWLNRCSNCINPTSNCNSSYEIANTVVN